MLIIQYSYLRAESQWVENKGDKLFGPINTSTPKVQTTARTATNALETLQK